MAKFKYIEWLVSFLESSDFFIFQWDDGNKTKSEMKHNVGIDQVESALLDAQILPLGLQYEPTVSEERYAVLGKDYSGNILFICFTIRQGHIRPISARVANKKERSIYER